MHGGFTLVETIVILVILAILAAILIPAMTGWIDKAKQKRLVVACRTCVNAAQTLVSEEYGATGLVASPDSAAVLTLAGLTGTVSVIELETTTATVAKLAYSDGDETVTYTSTPVPTYTFGPIAPSWETGKAYTVGDTITTGGYIFECIRSHTSGETKTTRDPTTGSNKGTWEITGYADGEPRPYSSTFRYAAGVKVTYKNYTDNITRTYVRTDHDPTSSPLPFVGSAYWNEV